MITLLKAATLVLPFPCSQEAATEQHPRSSANETSAPQTRSCRWKRPLDLALILLTVPLWIPVVLLVAAWIKCVSPGPVFYRQERVGLGQRRFMIYKFRSMRICAESETHANHVSHLIRAGAPMTKLDHRGDTRLIPLGRFVRATGLDELPQIFNVLRGEMSLVGPRPCTPYELCHYQREDLERVHVLPGLTGYWQVNGKNRTTFREMIELDRFYARNASLLLDLRILARTLSVLVLEVVRLAPWAHR